MTEVKQTCFKRTDCRWRWTQTGLAAQWSRRTKHYGMCWPDRSLAFDVGSLDDRPPLLNLGPVKGRKRLRRLLVTLDDLLAQVGQPWTDRRIGQFAYDCRIEFHDHIFRRALRCPNRVPDRRVEPRQSRLVDRRDVWSGGQAVFVRDCIGLNVAAPYLRQARHLIAYNQVDLSGNQILRCRTTPAIVHKLEASAYCALEENAQDMLWTGHPGRPCRRFVRIELQPCDETFQVIRQHRSLCNDHLRVVGEQRDRFEIIQHIVLECIDCSDDDVRGPNANDEGVAIGRCASNPTSADAPARSGHVLDHNSLAERSPHALS